MNPELYPALHKLKIIMETHPMFKPGVVDRMHARFGATHDIVVHLQGPKAPKLPQWLQDLGHLDHLIAVWEFRAGPTPPADLSGASTMTLSSSPNFAFYYTGDAYTTTRKIMGRQSAGKALMNGVARRWSTGEIHAFGADRKGGEQMLAQLRANGHSGSVRWREAPGDAAMTQLGALYYPAPPSNDLAKARNTRGPAAYSLFGVTHTLSSAGAMDQIAQMVLPPFQPWDALICTSTAALEIVTRMQEQMRQWMAEHTGAT
eukprot:gene55669-76303_t